MIDKRQDLVEIKKGKTGTGLLIENDGFISSSVSEHNKKLTEGITKEMFEENGFIVDAVLQKFGIENANGRIYPEDVLRREAEKYQQMIIDHTALSELNHPESSNIDLGRISHSIIEMHFEGHTLIGKLKLNITEGFKRYGICSSMGDVAANLIINGYKIGISSRGVGTVENKYGKTIVGNDFELIGFDLVSTPSTPGAWLSTEKEGLQQYIESDETKNSPNKTKIQEKIEQIEKILTE
jgi:hypothetical protein